ncbi:MAG: YggT family protein, partial [Pseudoalteromonas spongiae]
EPMLRPIRKIIPPIGGLDLSILVLIIGLQFLQILFLDLFR